MTAGRATSVAKNDRMQTVTATFDGGLIRVYTYTEIADHVAQLAEDMIERPDKVSEPWHDFLRQVVGAEHIAQACAMVAMLKPEKTPAGLHTRFSD